VQRTPRLLRMLPENTLLSFRKAVENGMNPIEFEPRMTKNRKLVGIHSAAVDRVTKICSLIQIFTSIPSLYKIDVIPSHNIKYVNE